MSQTDEGTWQSNADAPASAVPLSCMSPAARGGAWAAGSSSSARAGSARAAGGALRLTGSGPLPAPRAGGVSRSSVFTVDSPQVTRFTACRAEEKHRGPRE